MFILKGSIMVFVTALNLKETGDVANPTAQRRPEPNWPGAARDNSFNLDNFLFTVIRAAVSLSMP